MITRLEATRYRCLERLDVDLGEFALVVGANGAGKSTFLDLLVLFGDLLQQKDVGSAFTSRLRGQPPRCATFSELIFCGRGDDFILAVEAELPDAVIRALLPGQPATVKNDEEQWPRFIRYELRLGVFNQRRLEVNAEYLFLFSRSALPGRGGARLLGETAPKKEWRFIIRRDAGEKALFRNEVVKAARSKAVHIDAGKPALARVHFESREEYPAAVWLHGLLTDQCLAYRPSMAVLQTASPPGRAEMPAADAGNLPWLTLLLRKTNPRLFDAWVDHVRTALPQVASIEACEREEDHHAYFKIQYQGGYNVTSSGLSEGTLRILALTLLPYLERRPTILLVEEPELGIHPRGIETVLQSLMSVYDSQVLVSSHSPVVMAQCRLEQVLCARLDEAGAATIVSGRHHPRLAEWKGRIDLGALFAAGVLG
ncbi:MAG TPA: ATP-binding protein [Candidatus Ozemobacteraceae bacterium]|nr:ATP-binding protein [Candidatus Ozemobacteraceae bacterium]